VLECSRYYDCGKSWSKIRGNECLDRRRAFHVVLVPIPAGKSRKWQAEVTGFDGKDKPYQYLTSGPVKDDIVGALTELLAKLDVIRRPRG